MTAVSPQMIEELIGIRMLELARSEGHQPGFPKNDRMGTSTAQTRPRKRGKGVIFSAEMREMVLRSIKKGINTADKMARAHDVKIDTIRRTCRQLQAEGLIARNVLVDPRGGRKYVWSVFKP